MFSRGVRDVIAVVSAKGGVGKSTVAANLAVALATRTPALSVGLCDLDVHGPSVPRILGVTAEDLPEPVDGERGSPPAHAFGVACMSSGLFVDAGAPVALRAPMANQLQDRLLFEMRWAAGTDVLIADTPPGTGDAILSLAQRVRLSGAVVVTTPQKVAADDAKRGVALLKKLGVPLLGVVENMAHHDCPSCGHRERIFQEGGGLALEAGVRLEAVRRCLGPRARF